jgi:hypothetical protein
MRFLPYRELATAEIEPPVTMSSHSQKVHPRRRAWKCTSASVTSGSIDATGSVNIAELKTGTFMPDEATTNPGYSRASAPFPMHE